MTMHAGPSCTVILIQGSRRAVAGPSLMIQRRLLRCSRRDVKTEIRSNGQCQIISARPAENGQLLTFRFSEHHIGNDRLQSAADVARRSTHGDEISKGDIRKPATPAGDATSLDGLYCVCSIRLQSWSRFYCGGCVSSALRPVAEREEEL